MTEHLKPRCGATTTAKRDTSSLATQAHFLTLLKIDTRCCMIDENTTFMAACSEVCGTLPEGWTIKVHLELDSGYVWLMNPEGDDVKFPCNHENIAQQLKDAVDHAVVTELAEAGIDMEPAFARLHAMIDAAKAKDTSVQQVQG
jgi:hypothetical protein